MGNFQKFGGIAALIEAAAYVAGFVLYFFVLDASGYVGPTQHVAYLVDNQSSLFLTNLFVYVIFSVVLVVLVLALHERLKANSSEIMRTATAFGLIWAGLVIASGMIFNIGMKTVVRLYAENPDQAGSVWLAIGAVQEGLGGGNEIVGGLWVLLVSWAALRAGDFSKLLNYIGVLIGLAGILTVFPLFDILTAVFGLGQIVWFVWLGIDMLVDNRSATAS